MMGMQFGQPRIPIVSEGVTHGRVTSSEGRIVPVRIVRRRVFALALGAGLSAVGACDPEGGARLYATEPFAPSLTEAEVANLDHLGPQLVDLGVNFSVYSANAERMELFLFDDPEADRPTRRFEMERFGDVWSLYVEGIGRGQHYGYVAWGPNWTYSPDFYPGSVEGFVADVDGQGNRFNPNKLLLDPYAKVVHRDHDWGRASNASGPARAESTWGAAAKSIVWETEYDWSEHETTWRTARANDEAPAVPREEVIVYEVHPKGLTADAASGVKHPGTFRGVGEMAAYFADLNITAVEFLPVHEKPLDGGYWGYNNLSYFALENTYAAADDPLEVVDEFKWMVDQLHQQGIEVWVDVVYNHTGEGGLWRERIYQDDTTLDEATSASFYNFEPQEVASLYSWRGLDNASYYRLSPDNLTYSHNTGVGNQTRCNNTPFRRQILDSLTWMVEELHVDGFRFDLAPVLGEVEGGYDIWDPDASVLQAIVDDPLFIETNTRFTAEPWAACWPCYQPVVGDFPGSTVEGANGWGEWNARFRDWWRSFVNYDDWKLDTREAEADGGFTLTGSYDLYADEGRSPVASTNFVTVHDGFTLYDLVSYEEKNNGCSPLNPVCCDRPTSPWCEAESGESHNRSRNWGSDVTGEAMKRQMMRNFFVAMLVSHGTPLILGGDEWMRTQLGNNNAFSTQADNPFNWHEWGKWRQSPTRVRMHDFVRDLIAVRRDHLYAFSPDSYDGSQRITWMGPSGGDPDWGSKQLMVRYAGGEDGPDLLVIINMERYPVSFTLPGGDWERLVDTQRWFDTQDPDADDFFDQNPDLDPGVSHNVSLDAPEIVSGSYQAQDSSMLILRAAGG